MHQKMITQPHVHLDVAAEGDVRVADHVEEDVDVEAGVGVDVVAVVVEGVDVVERTTTSTTPKT